MSNEALAPLRAELDAAPPPSLARLGKDRIRLLADALHTERAARHDGLEDAAEEALKLVPALARGAVRKVLFQ